MPTKKGSRPRHRPRLDPAVKQARGTYQPARDGPRRAAEPVGTEPPVRDYGAIALQYAAGVLEGRIPACKWVRLAVERQDRDLRTQADPAWPYVWSDAHARAACQFLERLPHVEGAWGSATVVLQPWQVFLVSCLYGWRHRADLTRRRFTNLYLELGRKGAKSTLLAGLLLFHLLREDEPGAQAVCGATTGAQARIVFAIAQKMVKRSAWLRAQGLEALANAIVTADGSIKPINAKASTQDGLNPSCIVLDESHAQTFALHDVLKSAQGARKNPLLACPTTAGYDLLSVGYALRTTVCKVLEQVFPVEHLLGVIYTLDEGDDWRDERVWIKANPMIGVTPSYDWVRAYCADAQATPGLEGEFRVKVCSLWAQASSAWLSMAAWDACADPTLRLDAFTGQPCWIGIDLSGGRDDFSAVALLFETAERHLVAFVRQYLPALVVDKRARAVPEYRTWAATAGLLTLTEGDWIDIDRIGQDLRAWAQQFTIRDCVFDQFGDVQLARTLEREGMPARLVAKNAATFTGPAREFEARVNHGRFRHDGNSCVRWQASNVVVSRRVDGSILPKKEHGESPNKIDAIDAILQAIGGWQKTQATTTPTHEIYIF